jgi:cell division protein FtsN
MPKDYKNRRSSPPKKQASCWLWLITGLAVGLLVALFTYLTAHPPAHNPMAVTAPARPPAAKAPKPKPPTKPMPAKQEAPKPRFEFYSILPEMEVPVTAKALPERSAIPPEESVGSYLLQVGSFRGADEAERLKAQLALLGLEASIQTVSVNGKQTWHRVRIGPFTSLKEAYGVQDRLAREKMEAIVLKISS